MPSYPYNTLGDSAMMAPTPRHGHGYGYGTGRPLVMPRNQDFLAHCMPLHWPALALSALSLTQP
jgi:hypothetical protein